jgi:endonuclease-3 related protein
MTDTPPAWRELEPIYEALDAMHGDDHWHWWPPPSAFEIAVGCILVQNTTWASVEKSLALLRHAGALDPDGMRALNDEQLEACIRPSGVFRVKARKLRTFLDLLDRFDGRMDGLLALPADELRANLLATWGIGRETADAIALYAGQKPVWIVDAYLLRLFGRLGIGPDDPTLATSAQHARTYETWRAWFEERLPLDVDLYARFRALTVIHCKKLCRVRPKCAECLLLERCEFGRAGAAPRGRPATSGRPQRPVSHSS